MKNLVQGSLHLLDDYFEDKEITEQELEQGKHFVRIIFNKDINYEINESNELYGQLIKLVALANRYPLCSDSLEYIMQEFQQHIHSNWRASYNLIFNVGLNPSMSRNGVVKEDIISQIKYRRRLIELSEDERRECNNLQVLIMEINCITRLYNEKIRLSNLISIQDFYNFLEKYDRLFNDLFGFHPTHSRHNLSMNPFRQYRNAIAHSNYIIQNNRISLVDWEWQNGPYRVRGVLSLSLDDVSSAVMLMACIISQIVCLYQLMYQSQ